MRKIYLFLVSILFFTNSVGFSQAISISDPDMSEFPKILTSMMAFQPGGDTYSDLSVADFEVWENGVQIPPSMLNVWCNISPMKVVLVLDKSTSMQDMIDTVRKWDWVIEGATNFIDNFQFTNGSEIAITVFGGTSSLKCDFTNNRQLLFDSLMTVTPYGKTNYNAAFMGPNENPVDLLRNQPAKFRRIVVFLTDGMHDDDQAGPVLTDSISNQLVNNNIQIFAISLLTEQNNDLSNIAYNSGGDYNLVTQRKQLTDFYSDIALSIKDKNMCFLSWETTPVCDEIERWKKVKIVYKRHSVNIFKTYQVPETGVAKLANDEKTYQFGNPTIGNYKDVVVTLTAESYNASITDFNINPPAYFNIVDYGYGEGVQPTYPIIVEKGKSHKIILRFTPSGTITFRKANLIINANPCSSLIPLIGGVPEIMVTNPMESEVFSACDNIEIKWSGISDATKTDLFYSKNDGNTWTNFATGITNNKYTWKPNFEQVDLRLKAEVSPAQTYVWATSGGGKKNDVPNGIALSKKQDAVYVCGFLTENAVFGEKYIQNYGQTDAFLAKYDTDGNLEWMVNDGSKENDSAFAVTVDDQDFVYYVGTTYLDPIFGRKITPSTSVMLAQHLFIAKYASNGAIQTANLIGANSTYPYFRAWGRTVKQVGQNIQVTGYYTGSLKIGSSTLAQVNTPTLFVANFDKNLNFLNAYKGGTATSVTSVKDSKNFTYQIHNFTYYKDFDRYTLTSEGASDVAVTKFGLSSEGFDISDKFTVVFPKLSFTQTNLSLAPNCNLGDTCYYSYPGLLKNTGIVPTIISGWEFTGVVPQPTFFYVDSTLLNQVLLPDETADVTIKLNSPIDGDMNVSLRFYGNCTEEAKSAVYAHPDCVTKTLDTIDIGKVFIGTDKQISYSCIVENMNNISLAINPIVLGKNANEFIIVKTQSDIIGPKSCYNADIKFRPNAYGERTARLNLNMQDPCGNQTIYLKGFGVYPSASLPDEVDWKVRRINTTYDSLIVIENPTTTVLSLNSIKWSDAPDGSEFAFTPFVTYPHLIPAGESITLPVSFSPTDDIAYESELIFEIQNKDSINNIPVKLKGQGFYPELVVDYICGDAVKPNETGIGTLTITNPSDNSLLRVDKIILQTPDKIYKWYSGAEPAPFTVAPGASQSFEVSFTPTDSLLQSVRFNIWADDFDAKFESFWKNTSKEFECQAVGITYLEQVEFGNNLICQNEDSTITITNKNATAPITLFLSQYNIIGNDEQYFTILEKTDAEIIGNGAFDLTILFNSDKPGLNTAKLIIPTSIGIDIEIDLEASVDILHLSASSGDYKELPGASEGFKLRLESPTFNQDITNLNFAITYPENQIRFDEKSFINKLTTNWTWSKIDFSELGKIKFEGSGIIPTPFDDEIAEMKMMFLLDTGKTEFVTSLITYECYESWDELANIYTLPVCFDGGRSIYITLDGDAPILEPISPNPSNGMLNLRFSLGKKMKVQGSIYDVFGQLVQELINDEYNAGMFDVEVAIDKLNSGIYFIKFGTETEKSIHKLIINK